MTLSEAHPSSLGFKALGPLECRQTDLPKLRLSRNRLALGSEVISRRCPPFRLQTTEAMIHRRSPMWCSRSDSASIVVHLIGNGSHPHDMLDSTRFCCSDATPLSLSRCAVSMNQAHPAASWGRLELAYVSRLVAADVQSLMQWHSSYYSNDAATSLVLSMVNVHRWMEVVVVRGDGCR